MVLLATYLNLCTGEPDHIVVQTDFETLNKLLAEVPEQSEKLVNSLAEKLAVGGRDTEYIDLLEDDDEYVGIDFMEHIFSLEQVTKEEEEGEEEDEEENEENDENEEQYNENDQYELFCYIPREEILPHFLEWEIPTTDKGWAEHYNRVLVMQYIIYLKLSQSEDEERALISSNLMDPIMFYAAKAQYGLQQ